MVLDDHWTRYSSISGILEVNKCSFFQSELRLLSNVNRTKLFNSTIENVLERSFAYHCGLNIPFTTGPKRFDLEKSIIIIISGIDQP